MPNQQRTYIAIDLKSFYASVECMDRGLDPLTTNLVVADVSRTEKTICLAVSPSLKAYGIGGRARLFEVVQRVRDAGTCSADPTVTAASNNGSVSSTSIPVQCASGVTSIRDNCSWDNGSGSGANATGGYGFVWAKTSENATPTVGGTNCSNYKLGNSIAVSTAFSHTITGLQANTSYTIRPYAKNGHGYDISTVR